MGRRSNAILRMTTTPARWILLVASILVFLVGIQLFLLTNATERFFAWTIQVPLTAAFLGAAYWSSFVMEYYASRQRIWVHARIAIPAVLIFTGITLIISLIHLDLFHLNEPSIVTRFLTWGWLAVYAVVPPAMIIALFYQVRIPGLDPPRQHRLPTWFRALLVVHALLLLPVGVTLLAAPSLSPHLWPWALTPLTARAVGAWLVGIGIAAVQSVGENDWRRIQPATMSYATFGVLELIALARYPANVNWGSIAAWVFLFFVVTALGAGLYGWWMATKVSRAWEGGTPA